MTIETAMPDRLAGNSEIDQSIEQAQREHAQAPNPAPSVPATNRFNLPAWAQAKYTVQISAAGNPYLKPIQSRVLQCVSDVPGLLDTTRKVYERMASEEQKANVDEIVKHTVDSYNAMQAFLGDGFDWLAGRTVLEGFRNQFGYSLYKAWDQQETLENVISRTCTQENITPRQALELNADCQRQQAWFENFAIQAEAMRQVIEATVSEPHAFERLIREGAQSAALIDGKRVLGADNGVTPEPSEARSAAKSAIGDLYA